MTIFLNGPLHALRRGRQGVRDLYRIGEDDGVFCYTFFKA